MSNPRLPPLQLLPAFDAAARHLSFTKAGQELHLSTAAVSQQIKQLEEWLGLSLFTRHVRRVALTPAGEQFATVVGEMLRVYRSGHASLMHEHAHPVVRLSVPPLVAHEWLLPALSEFQAMHPSIELQLDIRLELADLSDGSVDAAIRFGPAQWKGLVSRPLASCTATIAASPSLLQRQPFLGLEDFAQHTLIHARKGQDDWALAARTVGLERMPRKGDLWFDSDLASMRAAEQGLGLVICLLPVCASWLLNGSLVQVIPMTRIDAGFHFVHRPNGGKQALMDLIYEWLQDGMSSWAAETEKRFPLVD